MAGLVNYFVSKSNVPTEDVWPKYLFLLKLQKKKKIKKTSKDQKTTTCHLGTIANVFENIQCLHL